MEFLKSSKAIAVVSTALFVGSLVWLMNTKSVNRSLEAGLQKEKLSSESLLSEKLLLDKDLQKLKQQLLSLKEANLGLENVVNSTTAKLQRQESEYNRMKKENLSLAQVKKQRQDLLTLQSQLENELQLMKSANAELQARNEELSGTIAFLQERNKILTDDLTRAMFAAVDQSQIQAVKGKSEKLTVRARQTKKLLASFEVPSNLKNLSFKIKDPKGNPLNSNQGTIASTITPSENNYVASADSGVQGNRLQKVEVAFTPKVRLKTGVYTVEILNQDLYVGSMKVKLK